MGAGSSGAAGVDLLVAASSVLEDAFALAQLGLVGSPMQALEASRAASQSPAWLTGRGAHLLAAPVLTGLQELRPVLAGNASCAAGSSARDRARQGETETGRDRRPGVPWDACVRRG